MYSRAVQGFRETITGVASLELLEKEQVGRGRTSVQASYETFGSPQAGIIAAQTQVLDFSIANYSD